VNKAYKGRHYASMDIILMHGSTNEYDADKRAIEIYKTFSQIAVPSSNNIE
jgi:hypothetical protein